MSNVFRKEHGNVRSQPLAGLDGTQDWEQEADGKFISVRLLSRTNLLHRILNSVENGIDIYRIMLHQP